MPRPPALRTDARVAVVAPASAPPDPDLYRHGVEALRARGLQVEAPDEVHALGYLAGPDELRLEALNDALRRDDLDAIFCVRGGYGTLRLLPHLDYEAAAAHPKLLVGYSDITALQLALWTRAGVPSLSGPMVAPDWSRMDDASEAQFWQVVGGDAPLRLDGPSGEPLAALREGEAEGLLIGGNLTVLCALLGTPYFPDLSGAILFLEEIGEAPYKVDRMLAQLHLAGVLEGLGGLVLGAFTQAEPAPGRPSLTMMEVVRHYAAFVPGPVVGGLVYGHFRPKVAVPIGVRARLWAEGGAAQLSVLEPLTEAVYA
jgi:muramoyltetrapeptide carboxypeptidase